MNVGGVAYHPHLYTRVLASRDSDEIERWLGRDFETPAERSIAKAVNDERLYQEDYGLLVRFLAAQIVRTPAFFIKSLPHWQEQVRRQMEDQATNLEHNLRRAREEGELVGIPPHPVAEYFPMRVRTEPSPDGKGALIKMETVVGRGYWIFAMRHLLTSTIERLSSHHWTILSAEDDLPWFTTDDPVIRLNFRDPSSYDFGGGWEIPKTNILMPLSPRHLLFTQVGEKSFQRGEVLPRHMAMMLRKMMAEHAHRYIFSPHIDPSIPSYRPRIVDGEAVRGEVEQWRRWHEEQSLAEREMAGGPGTTL